MGPWWCNQCSCSVVRCGYPGDPRWARGHLRFHGRGQLGLQSAAAQRHLPQQGAVPNAMCLELFSWGEQGFGGVFQHIFQALGVYHPFFEPGDTVVLVVLLIYFSTAVRFQPSQAASN